MTARERALEAARALHGGNGTSAGACPHTDETFVWECEDCLAAALLRFAAEMMPRSAINEDADELRRTADEIEGREG